MAQTKTASLSKRELRRLTILSEIAEGRANLYRFFGEFYAQLPTKKSLAKLAEEAFLDDLTLLFGKRAVQPMRKFAEQYKPNKHIDDIRQEFQDLFIVPIQGKFVTPFESVYLTGLMLQQPKVQVKETFKKAGAEFQPTEIAHIEDHIGSELNFMAFLAQQESESWEQLDKDAAINYLKYEVGFLEDHLTQWVDDFAKKLEAHAVIDLYAGMARMTAKFINMDYVQVADILEKLEEE